MFFRQVREEDLKWFYVAHKTGSFALDEDLDPVEFKTRALEFIGLLDDAFTLFAQTGRGEIPVGLMMVGLSEHRMEPHVFWFSWASARNKLESTVNFINEMRGMWKVHIVAEEKYWPFFVHVCRYGIMKRVGKLEGWYAKGDAMMFLSLGGKK